MIYNPQFHHRHSIRLKGYDYSRAGLYFITICINRRGNPLWLPFGNTANGKMILNDAGKMVENEWLALPGRFKNIELHEYVVMPNHFHAILEIVGATHVVAQNNVVAQNGNDENNPVAQNENYENNRGQPQGIAPTTAATANSVNVAVNGKTVGDMVGAFQSIVTVNYIRGVKTLGWQPFNGKLWQRNYWEHIIRDEQSYHHISDYIINNPAKWSADKFFAQ